MIAPGAVVADVHADFALAGGLGHRTVHVDLGAVEEVVGLSCPDLQARVVDDIDERVKVRGRKATAEVAGRGRVGNAARAEGVEEILVVAAQFDVLQASAIAQGVVGEVEHVVGFLIGQVKLQQMQPLVNRF